MTRDHVQLHDVPEEALARGLLEADYAATMWEPGG
jgi:hypothetical protein